MNAVIKKIATEHVEAYGERYWDHPVHVEAEEALAYGLSESRGDLSAFLCDSLSRSTDKLPRDLNLLLQRLMGDISADDMIRLRDCLRSAMIDWTAWHADDAVGEVWEDGEFDRAVAKANQRRFA